MLRTDLGANGFPLRPPDARRSAYKPFTSSLDGRCKGTSPILGITFDTRASLYDSVVFARRFPDATSNANSSNHPSRYSPTVTFPGWM
jgi:hypothetical protein